jgi:hypothetical protein
MVSYPTNELLLRLILAEAGNEKTEAGDDLVGMAAVANSILLRQKIIQANSAPGTFNANSDTLRDVMTANRNNSTQFQPFTDGRIHTDWSKADYQRALSALEIALTPGALEGRLKSAGLSDEEVSRITRSPNFNVPDAPGADQRMQSINPAKLLGHRFNTAGNESYISLHEGSPIGDTANTDSGAFKYPAPEDTILTTEGSTQFQNKSSDDSKNLTLGLQYGFAAQGAATDKQAKAEGADVKSGMYKLGKDLAKATKFGAEVFTPAAGELAITKLGLKLAGPLGKAATQVVKNLPFGRILGRAASGAASAGASNLVVNATGSLFAPKYNEENTKNNLKQAAFTAGAGAVLNPIFGFMVDSNTRKVGVENVLGQLKAYAQSKGQAIDELVKGGDQEVINIFKSIADDYTQLVKPFDDVIKSGVDTKKLSKEAYKELVDQVSNATKPIIDNMKAAGGQVIANQTKKVKLPEGLIDTLKLIQKNAVFTRGDSKGPKKLAEQIDSIISSAGLDSKDRVVEKISTDLPEWKMIPTKTTQIVVKPPKATEANAEAIVNSIKEIKALMKDVPAAKKFADLLDPYVDTITDSVPSLKFAKDVDKVYSDVLKGFGIDPTDVELSTMAKIVKKSVADPSYTPSADKLVSLMDNPKLRITTKGTPLEGKISILNPEIQAQRVKEAEAAKELVQYQFGKGKPGATNMFNLLDNYTKFKQVPQTDKISKAFLDSDVGSLINNSVKNQKITPQQVEKAYMFSFAENAGKAPALTKEAEAKFMNQESIDTAKNVLSGWKSVNEIAAEEGGKVTKNLPNNPLSGAMNFKNQVSNTPLRTTPEAMYTSPRDVTKNAVKARYAVKNALGGDLSNTPLLNEAITKQLAPGLLDNYIGGTKNVLNKQDISIMIDQGRGGAFANASDAPINVADTENLLRNAAMFNSLRPVAAPLAHGLPGATGTFGDILNSLFRGNNERR